MTFANLQSGEQIFLDANTLAYHFGPDPVFGPACSQLVRRIEQQDLSGFVSTHVLTELAHQLMMLETVLKSRIRVLTIDPSLILTAAGISQAAGLLSSDALIVAVMQQHGLTRLASNDRDFDRVPGPGALRAGLILLSLSPQVLALAAAGGRLVRRARGTLPQRLHLLP